MSDRPRSSASDRSTNGPGDPAELQRVFRGVAQVGRARQLDVPHFVERPKAGRWRRWRSAVIGGLATLGLLGAVSSYYLPGILDSVGARVTGRHPLDYDVLGDRTATPNFVFPADVSLSSIPQSLLDNGSWDEQALEEFRQWAFANNGIVADEQEIRIVIRGRDNSVVHLDDIRIVIVEELVPRSGWVNLWDGCGAVAAPRILTYDADARGDPQWIIDGRAANQPSFTVTSSDEEVFDIQVLSTEREIRWVFEVHYSSAERDGVLTIDNDGEPFTLTTVSNAQGYLWAGGERWEDGPVHVSDWTPDSPDVVRPVC